MPIAKYRESLVIRHMTEQGRPEFEFFLRLAGRNLDKRQLAQKMKN